MKKHIFTSVFAAALAASSTGVSAIEWDDNSGIPFNQPSVNFNPAYHGYGSSGQRLYNKIDLQDGRPMYIEGGQPMHDNQGNIISYTKDETSIIGYYDGERDGGLVAGSYTRIRDSSGSNRKMTYAWSVNLEEGGRGSGWVLISALTPQRDLSRILRKTRRDKRALWNSQHQHSNYEEYTIKEATLPSYMADYYLDPDRDASYNAGKAKYYYTRDGIITGLINIPETGSQRYGVGHDVLSVGTKFQRDMNVPIIDVSIYPPSSSVAESHKLQLAWGYSKTNAGRIVYSWVNNRTLD